MIAANRLLNLPADVSDAPATSFPIEIDKRYGHPPSGSDSMSLSQPASPTPDVVARLIAPPADARRRDRTFDAIRQGLIDRFKPTESDQLLDIDLVAADIVLLASYRRAIELLLDPRLGKAVSEGAIRAPVNARQVKLLERAASALEAGKPLFCTERQCATLARLFAESFDRLTKANDDMTREEAEIAAEKEAALKAGRKPRQYRSNEDFINSQNALAVLTPIAADLRDAARVGCVLSNRKRSPKSRSRWTDHVESGPGRREALRARIQQGMQTVCRGRATEAGRAGGRSDTAHDFVSLLVGD